MAAKQETERSSPEINACKVIIKRLFSSTYKNIAWVFYEPLDPQLLGLHDYHEIVREPMDLSTVRHRLNTGCYLSAADFAKDIRLIFYNTYLYTNPDHLCYHMAKQLQIIFEEMYSQVQLYICSSGSKVRAEEESSSDESDSSSPEDEVNGSEVSPSIMGAPPHVLQPPNVLRPPIGLRRQLWKLRSSRSPLQPRRTLICTPRFSSWTARCCSTSSISFNAWRAPSTATRSWSSTSAN